MTEIRLKTIVDSLPSENPYQRMLTRVLCQFPQTRVSSETLKLIRKGGVKKGKLHHLLTAGQGVPKSHASGAREGATKKHHSQHKIRRRNHR